MIIRLLKVTRSAQLILLFLVMQASPGNQLRAQFFEITPSVAVNLKLTNSQMNGPGTQLNKVSNKHLGLLQAKAGLMVYVKELEEVQVFDGTEWQTLDMQKEGLGLFGLSYIGIQDTPSVLNDQGEEDDFFGFSVDVAGDYAAVGAPGVAVGNSDKAGVVSIYKRVNKQWVLNQTIAASLPQVGARFGYSVSQFGEYLAVGAPFYDNASNSNEGRVYIFKRDANNNYQQIQQFGNPLNAGGGDYFGWSVDMDESYMVAGAYRDRIGNNFNQGSASIFKRNGTNWTYNQLLTDGLGATNDYFGTAVAIDGNHIAVGSPGIDDTGENHGGVLVFENVSGQWTEIQRSLGTSGHFLGSSLALKNSRLMAGAPGVDYKGSNVPSGGVYHFYQIDDTFDYQSVYQPKALESQFGTALAVNDNQFYVGIPNNPDLSDASSGIVLKKTFGTADEYYFRDATYPGKSFYGKALAVDANTLIIGGYQSNSGKGKISFVSLN